MNPGVNVLWEAKIDPAGFQNNLIKMIIKNNLMTITSRSEEGNVKEEIVMEKTGEDLDIGSIQNLSWMSSK